MNERIKELAEQAGWMMSDEVEGFNTRLEKFAELIVRECALIANLNNKAAQGVNLGVGRVIKHHFGVSE